jgi:hypothetical protein
MTTVININPNLFIDIEGAYISASTDLSAPELTAMKRSTVPYSELKGGKFRRLFNRHQTAYRR